MLMLICIAILYILVGIFLFHFRIVYSQEIESAGFANRNFKSQLTESFLSYLFLWPFCLIFAFLPALAIPLIFTPAKHYAEWHYKKIKKDQEERLKEGEQSKEAAKLRDERISREVNHSDEGF